MARAAALIVAVVVIVLFGLATLRGGTGQPDPSSDGYDFDAMFDAEMEAVEAWEECYERAGGDLDALDC